MANISDAIEQFILDNLGEDDAIDISRNELASFFSCAPSQINYVLETRFTLDRGYIKESRRGGGGYIRIQRVPLENDDKMASLVIDGIGDELTIKRAEQIVEKLMREGVISKREKGLIDSMISGSALAVPLAIKDRLRAQVFKACLVYLLSTNEEI
ncbi:MAG: CtsR family transcriptional regulator [Clostridia bacterium]|nr:CtsR family transcriptional regulator [Clostridia bacterium]